MSNTEKTSDPRDEIAQLVPGAASLDGFRTQATELGWQVDANEMRKRLKLAYTRLKRGPKRGPKRDDELLGVESLKVTTVEKIVHALGSSTGWDRCYQTPSAALMAPDEDQPHLSAGAKSPLTRQERVVRQVMAQARDDKVELRLIQHATPYQFYRWSDTTLPILLLDLLSLTHVSEQLDRAAMVANALFCSALQSEDWFWDFIGLANAYFFKIGREGWQQFAQGLGLDPDTLVARNHQGAMLMAFGEKICGIAPTADELKSLAAKAGHPVEEIVTAEDVAQGWRDDFMQILEEPKRS